MNILLVTGPAISLKEPFSSGIEAFVVMLANQLAANGHSVDVVAKDSEAGVLFNVVNLAAAPPKIDYKKRLTRAHKEDTEHNQTIQFDVLGVSHYDVIHYNLFIPELYEAGKQFKKPSVLTLHLSADAERAPVYRAFANHTNATFVTVSNRLKKQWIPLLDNDIAVIHNGVDLRHWSTKGHTKTSYLLWSGRINDAKNVIAAIAVAKHTNLPLKIAGKIADQDYFDTHVKPQINSDIQYVGHATQKELNILASGAIAFLATANIQEAFGLASLEMLASGVPVVGFASALPSDLLHPNVSVATSSSDWHDLVELLDQVKTADPQDCRNFARTMSNVRMARAYQELYATIV